MWRLAAGLCGAAHTLTHFLIVSLSKEVKSQHGTFPTESVVKELCDVEGAAGRPGRRVVKADEQGSHQVMSPQLPKQPLTGLGVIVRHTEHMTCQERAQLVEMRLCSK